MRKENGVIAPASPNKDTKGRKMRGEEKKYIYIKCSRAKDLNFPSEKACQVFKTME